jgi:chromosome segregation ATPase
MAENDLSIESLRDRLTDTLAEWGAQFSVVLSELDQKRGLVEKLHDKAAQHDERVGELQRQLKAQSELMGNLQDDIAEANRLRKEVQERDVETDRLGAELASKQELVRALRRDAEGAQKLKEELRLRDQRIRELEAANRNAQQEALRLTRELDDVAESAQQRADSVSEVAALHAELDARKTLIKSMRSDLKRLSYMEEEVEEKRQVIAKLEDSVDRHSKTIEDLHATIDRLRTQDSRTPVTRRLLETGETLPPLSGTDVQRALEDPEVEHTIAIDMRESLIEARRTVNKTDR